MDFRNHFSPFSSIFRRDRRTEQPTDDFVGQYYLGIPGLSFDNPTIYSGACPSLGMRLNDVQNFDWTALPGREIPFKDFTGGNSDGIPLRVRFTDVSSIIDLGASCPFYAFLPEQLPNRGRFVDVLDEERRARIGTGQRRGELDADTEDALSPLDFIDEYYTERQRRPQARRGTLSPKLGSTGYRYGDPKIQERQFRNKARRQSTPRSDGYRDWNPRSGAQKEGTLPFEKAMQWLHEALVSAENFYKKFQDDYDKEVRSIKYAGVELLQKLWVKKVTGKGAPGLDGSQDRMSADKWEETFVERKWSLCKAMEAALNAKLDLGDLEPPKPIILEARKRLQEKVDTACQQVVDLLDSATNGSDQCKVLLGELRLLKELVDPKKNRNLFEGVEGGDAGGGQDNGGYNNDE